MKIKILLLAILCFLFTGCASSDSDTHTSKTDGDTLPDTLLESYYLSSEDSVYTYLQNKSINRFLNSWFQESIAEDVEPQWNFDTMAPVQILDHDFNAVTQPDDELYSFTFSTNDNRYGYIIVNYGEGEEGPYISKWSLQETSPYVYDLRANSSQIADALKKTDIDLTTAHAARVEWVDTEKNRGDCIILFTDGSGNKYLCDLGDDDFTIEKQ